MANHQRTRPRTRVVGNGPGGAKCRCCRMTVPSTYDSVRFLRPRDRRRHDSMISRVKDLVEDLDDQALTDYEADEAAASELATAALQAWADAQEAEDEDVPEPFTADVYPDDDADDVVAWNAQFDPAWGEDWY